MLPLCALQSVIEVLLTVRKTTCRFCGADARHVLVETHYQMIILREVIGSRLVRHRWLQSHTEGALHRKRIRRQTIDEPRADESAGNSCELPA